MIILEITTVSHILYTIATTGYNSEGKPNYVYNWGFGDYGKSFIW